MSQYNEHSSLYENSDYPSRRQAPDSSHASGGGKQPARKRKRRRKRNPVLRGIGIFFKVLGTLLLIGLITGGYNDGQNLNLAVGYQTITQFARGLF